MLREYKRGVGPIDRIASGLLDTSACRTERREGAYGAAAPRCERNVNFFACYERAF